MLKTKSWIVLPFWMFAVFKVHCNKSLEGELFQGFDFFPLQWMLFVYGNMCWWILSSGIKKKRREWNGGRQHSLVNKVTDLGASGDLDTIPSSSLQCDFRQVSEQAFPHNFIVYLYCKLFRASTILCCMFLQPQLQRNSALHWNIPQTVIAASLHDALVRENINLPFCSQSGCRKFLVICSIHMLGVVGGLFP